jgi:hypothetical protein
MPSPCKCVPKGDGAMCELEVCFYCCKETSDLVKTQTEYEFDAWVCRDCKAGESIMNQDGESAEDWPAN